MAGKSKPIDWERARADHEIGASLNAVAKKYGISRRAVQLRAKKESWEQDVTVSLDRKVAEKVAGIVAGSDSIKRAEAIDSAAGEVAAVVTRHRREWTDHAQLLSEAMDGRDFDKARLAKITAEIIMIRQTGERRAWGIDKDATERKSLPEFLDDLQ